MKSYEEFLNLKNQISETKNNYEFEVSVGMGTCGISSGAKKIYDKIDELIKTKNLKNINLKPVGCIGICALEPIVEVYSNGKRTTYVNVTEEKIERIIEEHINQKRIISEYLIDGNTTSILDLPFIKKQTRIALRNCGTIGSESINDYIYNNGYSALINFLKSNDRLKIINTVKNSLLRGRGGAGFPTGVKWESAYNSSSDIKYVCCNADEGDPGAFMDRAILEGDPHSVIEAMIIAGFAIGASNGYIYVRAEYPLAVKRLTKAMEECRNLGLLGNNILGTDFSFDINIKLGAGAFVCGEETALINSIEGRRGEPRIKPPYPTTSGINNKPTLLNNVETYANIAEILNKGSEWFSNYGTEKSKGTKVFAVGGKIKTTGLVEIPIGTTLNTLVNDICGGVLNDKKFKAAQIGGPSGGAISLENINTPLDYEVLINLGSMMGSGGLIVMDEDTCMVDIAKYFLEFTVDESCGKCVPCRIGTKKIHNTLINITKGKASENTLSELEELCNYVKSAALCGLGMSAPNPVISLLNNFRSEFESHVNNKKCPSKVCKDLISYKINSEKCIGCGMCSRVCPVHAISGELKSPHLIDESICERCGACYNACKVGAIYKGDKYE